jgi:aryl-alcohol dehydrogenase-like predicted oxidoreductase
LAQPGVTAPIASATNAAQLLEITQSVDLALGAEDLAVLAPDAALEIEHRG